MGNAGETWDDEYDVVVAGSGAGAMAGALTAAANGLRTAVLEKTNVLGGTSAYSGSAIWLPGTRVQERAGIGDSTGAARAYLRALLGDGTAAHREAFLETAPELVEFLERDPAIEFEFQAFPDYFDAPGRMDMGRSFVPLPLPADRLGDDLTRLVRPPVDRDRAGRGHSPSKPLVQGRALIGRLLLAITATGNGDVRTGTALTALITENGQVTGVTAGTADGPVRLRARRGVLLAAGGFEASDALRRERGVPGGAGWTMAPDGANTGDAITAGTAIGASTGLLDQAWFCPAIITPDGRAAFTLGFRGGLIVDGSGRRFANESLPYDQMGRRLAAAEGPFHLIFDARSKGLPAISVPPVGTDEQVASGAWTQAGSITELADKIGLPALPATVERFNGLAASGTDDDFHRGEDPYDLYFSGGRPCVVAVDEAPYYAAKIVLSDLGTKGGLRTDPDARVLDGTDRPIPGLYAAGNTSASFTGPVYPGPGIPIGSAMAFAYRAVQDMRRNDT